MSLSVESPIAGCIDPNNVTAASTINFCFNNLNKKVSIYASFYAKYLRLLDSSCGDMTWMPTFLSNRSDVMFTGYDIVEDNINNHRQSFREKDWKFEVHDIVREGVNLKKKYERVLWDTW